jgi:inorganic pyrophosphatase
MTMTDREEVDHKVVAVHVNDPEFDIYQEAHEFFRIGVAVLERFFKDYKVSENKEVIVGDRGFDQIAKEVMMSGYLA